VNATPGRDAVFEEHRPVLFGVAYRMLGTVADAEDILQEAWLRWAGADVEVVRSPRAFLVTVVTRLCLDELRSARATRETYVGPWLPEPVPTGALAPLEFEPAGAVEEMDSISYGLLVLLERLSPVERAIFLLRDVFDYDYAEIAAIVNRSEAACRQALHRARERLVDGRARFTATYEERLRLTGRFLAAAREGEMAPFLDLLAEDVVLWSDGGGVVSAAINPIYGREKVARLSLRQALRDPGQRAVVLDVNGLPAFAVVAHGRVEEVVIIHGSEGLVTAMHVVRNPGKLRATDRALRAAGLLTAAG
jgi:RNA polymerase sigma-70 factor (ECF subfamily)